MLVTQLCLLLSQKPLVPHFLYVLNFSRKTHRLPSKEDIFEILCMKPNIYAFKIDTVSIFNSEILQIQKCFRLTKNEFKHQGFNFPPFLIIYPLLFNFINNALGGGEIIKLSAIGINTVVVVSQSVCQAPYLVSK